MAFAEASEDGEVVTLRQLYVIPHHQGHGIGGMLLDEIEDSFPEAKTFRLEVEPANTKAVRFYGSRGYVDSGEASPKPGAGPTIREMILRRG